ncbi:hypothetical protein PP175_17080 [Aneurinibacillus sp. Ricciae_BoGa-3]|uniref:hypothetical protein n=1 Tax=Aneurinibacillus sp. Ricciae_BoGa-3 TaxID=3022697 RepID=UPI0023409522|nr:hypothetical protein [Aneurinibacillus sp. Ricciae_BoGa-3]WCK53112.1 hypothetical protein PP175_17080 [Aneurinibacillus sp. Ricciae_BoGa-3]
MAIENALLNYLQIKVVADARPDDQPAQNTADFFYRILVDDHKLEKLEYSHDAVMYHVTYTVEGERHTQVFDRLAVEQMLSSIEAEPRYGR